MQNIDSNEHSDFNLVINKARARVIEALAQNFNLYDVPMSMGHLYGTIFFQDQPMTLDEMGSALGMSKTSMSTGVRTLMDLKMVNKVWVRGARKDHYEVEQDWHQNFIDYFSIKWRKAIDYNVQALNRSLKELKTLQGIEDIPTETIEIINKDIVKMNNALKYYDWLNRLIDSFESHEIFNFMPK